MKKLTAPIYISSKKLDEYTIIISKSATEAEIHAAEELQKYIELATDITLEIITDEAEMLEAEIIIGNTTHYDTSNNMVPDAYRIVALEGKLLLYGSNDRGTLYAVYSYLEKYIGWRFFAEDCEVLREKSYCNIYAGEVFEDKPGLNFRDALYLETLNPDLRAKLKLNADIHNGRTPKKYGDSVGYTRPFVHTFNVLCPPKEYFESHPEYYALRDGERKTTQLCLTNPDVVKIVAENAINELKKDPRDYISVSQNDNCDYCTCEKCRAVFEEEGSECGLMLRFVNAVAEEIEKEFPNVLVDTLAYQYTRAMPKITKPRHNVAVRLCSIECCFRHPLNDPTCERNISFVKDIEDWNTVCDKLYIWDYVADYPHYTAPFPNTYILRENIRFYAEHNVVGLLEQSTYNGKCADFSELKLYLIGKLLWNPYMNKEEFEYHLIDFLKGYYGRGWEYIYKFLQRLNDETFDEHYNCFCHPVDHYYGMFKNINEFYTLCHKAWALCETEEEYKRIKGIHLMVLYVDICHNHDERWNSDEQTRANMLEKKEAYIADFNELGYKRCEWYGYPPVEEIDFEKNPMHW